MAIIVPPTPSNVVLQQGNGEVLVEWDQITGITSYTVARSTDNITFASVYTGTEPFYLDQTVTAGTVYYYKVLATNADGDSPYSETSSIVPAQSGQLSLGELRLMSQQRADRVNSDFVTKAEWNSYINQSYYELYDILTTLYQDYYTAEPIIFSTDGTTSRYDLPDGVNYNGARPFYKLLGVDMGLSTGQNAWVTVHNFNFISRNRFAFPNLGSTYFGVFNLRYRVFGNTLYFIPCPSAGQYIRLWYIPRLRTLLQDSDLCEGVSGWTEYIVVDAAIKALQKEESDVSALLLQKEALLKRIQGSAANRDAGEPSTISNARSFSEQWGGYGSPNGDGSYGGY